MRRACLLTLCILFLSVVAGCGRIKTYTYQEKRVDQDLSSGNRGVVMGDVPEGEPERKLTRTMTGVDVVLPDTKAYKARKKKGTGEREVEEKYAPQAPEEEESKGFADEQWVKGKEPAAKDMRYKIQEGDTLEKIAKKFLGSTRRWAEIYEVNRDVIKDPARIYPSQTIIIPGSLVKEEDDIK